MCRACLYAVVLFYERIEFHAPHVIRHFLVHRYLVQETFFNQFLQVGFGSRVRHGKPVLHLLYRQYSVGVICHERQDACLPPIYPLRFQITYCILFLLYLPFYVQFELPKSQIEHTQVICYKIPHVVIIRFRVQVRLLITGFRPVYYSGNRQVFREPITVSEHIPVKQGTRRPAVTVNERVHVCHHEMYYNGFYYRMYEPLCAVPVEKRTKLFNKLRNIAVRWRRVHRFVRYGILHHNAIVRPEPPLIPGIFQRFVSHQ